MEIKPEITEWCSYSSCTKKCFQIDDDIYMIELELDLEYDLDGEGRRRSIRRFYNWDGAQDEYARLENQEMIFWEFGIYTPLYQEYIERVRVF